MAHNLTDVDTFTSAVTVPDGGDPRTAASVELPFQSVANRTRNLKNRIDAFANGLSVPGGDIRVGPNHDFGYCDITGVATLVSRTVMLPLTSFVANGGGSGPGWELQANVLKCTIGFSIAHFTVPAPSGAVITRVRLAFQSAVGAGVSGGLYRKTPNKSPGAAAVTTVAPMTPVAGTALQIVSTGTIASPVVNRATEEWYVGWSGGVGDELSWVEVLFNDPGPRNY